MNMHNTTTRYGRGNKGVPGTGIFLKAFVCLLISQMVFFGIPISMSLLKSFDVQKVYAAGEVEFVSIVDPDNGADTDYTALISWEANNQVDLTVATTKVFSHDGITGAIADGAAVTGVTSGATAIVVHATGIQILLKNIVGTFQAEKVQVDASNHITTSNTGDPAISTAKLRASLGGVDVFSVIIDGWTTSATNYIKIWTDPSENHRHNGMYNTSKYRVEVDAMFNDTYIMDIKENYVRVEGLQFQVTNSGGHTGVGAINMDSQVTASDIRIDSNIIRGVITAANSEGRGIYGNDMDITARIYNNTIYDFVNGATVNNAGIETALGGTFTVYNNTLVDNYEAINVGAGTVIAKNNLVIGSGNTNTYIGTFAVGTDYNATNGTDSTGQGANNRISQTFTFIDTVSDDFHLAASDAGARDFGTTLSGDFTDDIDSVTRLGLWDIGADEYGVIPTLDSVTVSSVYGTDDTVTLTFSVPMDTSTIANGAGTLVIKYADDTSGTNEVIIPTSNATVVWSGGDTIATITLDGS